MITWEYHSAKFSFYTVKRERAASNLLVGNGQASILLLLVYNITRRSANSTLSTLLLPHHHTPYDDMFDDANDSRIVGKRETAKRIGDLGRLAFCAFSPERWGVLPKSPFLLSSLSLTAVSTNGTAGFLPSETESNKQPLIKQILTATSPAYTSSTIRRSHRRSRWWPPRGPSLLPR